jgi:hypothetical protein
MPYRLIAESDLVLIHQG